MTEEFQRTNPLDKNAKPLDVYAEHAEIRKQVHDEIKKLYVTMRSVSSSVNITTIDKFLGCLSPLKQLHDPGRLPVYAISTRSTVSDKQSCVWALVSCLVQAYWEYELGERIIHPDVQAENKEILQDYLTKLQKINEHYQELKIAGAENKGWWLEL